jgi:hypothetical protein
MTRHYGLVGCGGADFHVKREDHRFSPGSLNITYDVLGRIKDIRETLTVK